MKRKLLTVFSVALIIMFLLGVFTAIAVTPPANTFTISSGIYPGASAYTIYTNGTSYFAKNAYGQIIYSSTSASYVINSAITATVAGKISIDATGYFYLTTGINIVSKNGITLEGTGFGTVLSVPVGAIVDNVILIQDSSFITIRNLRLDGNQRNTGNGIGCTNVTYSTIDHVYIYAAPFSGVLLTSASYGNTIVNSKAQDCHAWGFGIQNASFENTINYCESFGCVDGFEISYGAATPSFSNLISNCISYSSGNCGYAIDNSYGNTIINCLSSASGTNGFEITHNSFSNTLDSNIARNSLWSGICIFNTTSSTPHHNIISNNQVYNSGVNTTAGTRDGISLMWTSNNTLTGNICINYIIPETQQYGIREYGSSNFNIISDCQAVNNKVDQILILGGSSVISNSFSGITFIKDSLSNLGVITASDNQAISHGLGGTPTSVVASTSVAYVIASSDYASWNANTFVVHLWDAQKNQTFSGAVSLNWYAARNP